MELNMWGFATATLSVLLDGLMSANGPGESSGQTNNVTASQRSYTIKCFCPSVWYLVAGITKTEMRCWQNYRHWLRRKLSKWHILCVKFAIYSLHFLFLVMVLGWSILAISFRVTSPWRVCVTKSYVFTWNSWLNKTKRSRTKPCEF